MLIKEGPSVGHPLCAVAPSASYSSIVLFPFPLENGIFSPLEALFDCHRLEAIKREDLCELQLKP